VPPALSGRSCIVKEPFTVERTKVLLPDSCKNVTSWELDDGEITLLGLVSLTRVQNRAFGTVRVRLVGVNVGYDEVIPNVRGEFISPV
jgi:hypothetical protein